jgi:SAM-dependent methyltransferase
MPAVYESEDTTAVAEGEPCSGDAIAATRFVDKVPDTPRPPDDRSLTPFCTACGSNRVSPAAFKRRCQLMRCEACGTLMAWPQPDGAELASLYSKASGYFATAAIKLADTPSTGARAVHQRLTAAAVPGNRFLDVGCGNGQLIYHLARLGWQVRGVDLNPDTVATACESGLDVIAGDLESCHWPAGSFDAIYMGDLIEHVPDPLRTLQLATRLLNTGGLLMIRTPNAGSSFATSTLKTWSRLGLPWPHSEAPYHLHEFTPKGLSTLVRRAGLGVVELRCTGRTPFLYTLGGLGWFDTLKAHLKRRGRYRLDWRLVTSAPGLVGAALMLLPFHLYASVANRLRCSGHRITLLARRSAVSIADRTANEDVDCSARDPDAALRDALLWLHPGKAGRRDHA